MVWWCFIVYHIPVDTSTYNGVATQWDDTSSVGLWMWLVAANCAKVVFCDGVGLSH
jgi:hypothetical protein